MEVFASAQPSIAFSITMKLRLPKTEVDVRTWFYILTFFFIFFGILQLMASILPTYILNFDTKNKFSYDYSSNPVLLPVFIIMIASMTLANASFSYARSELAKAELLTTNLEEVGEKLYLIAFNLGCIILLIISAGLYNTFSNITIVDYINAGLKFISVLMAFIYTYSVFRKLLRVFVLVAQVAAKLFIPDE